MLWFHNLKSDTKDTIEWLLNELKYLKDLKEELKKLKNDTTLSDKEKDYTKIKNTWDYIEKCQERSKKKIGVIIKELKKEIEKDPSIITLEKQIEIDSNKLFNAFSIYTSNFKNKLSSILADLKIQKERFGEVAKKAGEDITRIVDDIEKSLDTLINWVENLEAKVNEIIKQQNAQNLLSKIKVEIGEIQLKKDFNYLQIAINENKPQVAESIRNRIAKKIRFEINNEVIPVNLRHKLLNFLNKFENANILQTPSLIKEYESFFNYPITYLLRHLEAGPDTKYGTKTSRATSDGIKDGQMFSDFFVKMIILCPLNVEINIFTSPQQRARIFADLVRIKLNKIEGYVKISQENRIELDCEYYNREIEKRTGKNERELINLGLFSNEFNEWVKMPDGKIFFQHLDKFIVEEISATTKTKEAFTLNLMFTHLPNIGSFLEKHKLGDWNFKRAGYMWWYDGQTGFNK